MLGTKVTTANAPELIARIKNGAKEVLIAKKDASGAVFPGGGYRLSGNSPAHVNSACEKVSELANLPKGCGEYFVTIA